MLVTVQQLLKLSWAALEILVTSFPVPDFRIARNNFTVLTFSATRGCKNLRMPSIFLRGDKKEVFADSQSFFLS